jgi:NodT family efflux transporter outer membrane factor (OMF) lipoprotein
MTDRRHGRSRRAGGGRPLRIAVRLAGPLARLVTGGCSLVPHFVRPATPVPVEWENGEAGAAALWPEADWWRGFGSEPLDRLMETAQRNNYDLAAAAARVLQADAQTRIAGAPLLPALDGGVSGSRRWDRTSGSSSGRTNGTVVTTSFGASLSASYQLDLFGGNRAALASAEASALSSRFDRETVALTVLSGVASAYFQTVQLRERLAVARRNLVNAEEVLRVVRARVENGAASPLDLAQQRTVVAGQRASIPPLQAQAQQAEHALAILLGSTPAATDIAGASVMALSPPAVTPGLPSELLIRRPDIQTAEAQLLAANAQIGVARAAFFPSIALTADGGYASATLGSLFQPSSLFAAVAASVVQPIFSGGRLEGGLDFAKARHEELIANYRKAVISAFADVEDALVAIRRTAEQEELQADALEQARLAYTLAETRYRAGAVDLLAVLDAQRTLFQAEDQLVQIRSARLQAAVDMFTALGGGWQRPSDDGTASG